MRVSSTCYLLTYSRPATCCSHGAEPAAYSSSGSSSCRSRVRFEWVEAALEVRALAAAEAAAEAAAARAIAAGAAAAATEAEELQAERGGARIAARMRETLAAWFR